MIIDAVIPVLIEQGRAVTTKQLAEAAGLGEGTIFRAFGDKESLIEAAAARYFDPEPLLQSLRSIDSGLSLERKVGAILFHMRARMLGVHGMMNALGMVGRPPVRQGPNDTQSVIGEVLAPDLDSLRVSPERAVQFIRLVAFSAAIPSFNGGNEIPTDELARLITYGIADQPADGRSGNAA